MLQTQNKAKPNTDNKQFKLSGRQAYDRLTDLSTIITKRN